MTTTTPPHRLTDQVVFDNDRARFDNALAPYIVTLEDGAKVLAENTPPRLASAYWSLMQYGYANGLA